MSKWNGKRFSIYTSDEENVLNMVEELGKQTNHNTDSLDSKTDLHGDHKGSWQGLNRPTMSEEGMRATVEDIIDNKIPSIETSLDNITRIIDLKSGVEINNYTYLFFIICALCGYLKNISIIFLICFIHELGHVFFIKFFR